MMVECIKLLSFVCGPATQLLIQLFMNVPGKVSKDGPSVWASSTHVRALDEAHGFNLAQL